MGGEGQIIMGALVAAIVGGMDLGLPAGVHAAVAVLSAALVGVVLAFLPASLSLYRGASESGCGNNDEPHYCPLCNMACYKPLQGQYIFPQDCGRAGNGADS